MRSDRDYLRSAARLALRGHGRAEPNPLVGCVIAQRDGKVVGWGYHERCGGPHAEVHALRRAGAAAQGATAYVTLEPCNHTGRTGPCTKALIDAGIARVVIAREDPHPAASGGAARLRQAGVVVDVVDTCPEAIAVSDPFVYRQRTGLPWVIAKWAQTIDGRVATRSGQSQWISSEASRRMVHRERGRVDAILTGIGTVLQDDPLLTARGVRIRKRARRIVVDPLLKTPTTSQIALTAREVPTTIVHQSGVNDVESRAQTLGSAGAELIGIPGDQNSFSLTDALRTLSERHEVTNVLVEAGPGLLSGLFEMNLVCEAWVFMAGLLLGDDAALSPLRGYQRDILDQALRLDLLSHRQRGGDAILRYRVRNGT